jgi:hypothetical protein
MRVFRTVSIGLLAALTVFGSVDGTERYCHRSTRAGNLRLSRSGRSDPDHVGSGSVSVIDDSVALGWADEVRTGGQLNHVDAALFSVNPTPKPILLRGELVAPQPDAPDARGTFPLSFSRSPPSLF